MRAAATIAMLGLICLAFSSCSDDNSAWAKYTSPEGAFSVNMPINPKKTEKTEVTVFGKQVTHFITWKPTAFAIDKFKLFQVSYTECPRRISADSVSLNQALDSAIELRKKDFTESEIQSEPIELNGYPGRSFIYDGSGSIAIVKECIVNNKKYDLTVVTKKNYATNTEISNFFNSFQSLR